jgi:hypothetical protein
MISSSASVARQALSRCSSGLSARDQLAPPFGESAADQPRRLLRSSIIEE